MNDTLSSSVWPIFPTSRPNLSDQFSLGAMNAWQQDTAAADLYSPDDYTNVWSAKTENNDENEKDSFIKSIWSSNVTPSVCGTDVNSLGSDGQKQVDETPTNSPSLRRMEVINCNDHWGIVKINQITPWKVVDLEELEKNVHDPMVWRAKIDGTEVWEDYYMKQHGRRRPQADSSFSGDNVWSSTSDLSQSTTSIWPPKSNDVSSPTNDVYVQNMFPDNNNRSNFSAPNGVRPSMTRNQAQKYLIDMGYSLSDAIGALVNNQMDLPKAINELQSKYRMSSNNGPSLPPNGMYTPTLSFTNRAGDSVNMSRLPPGTPINNMVVAAQNNTSMGPMIGSNYGGNYDMFHGDQMDLMHESPYMNMEQNLSQFGRSQDPKLSMARDNSFRNPFVNNGMNSRSMSSNNCGQYNDMSALNQGMNRMNMNYNPNSHPLIGQNNKWSNNGLNGYSAMHNNTGITNNTNNNNNNMMHTTNGNIDMRQNFSSTMPGPGPAPGGFGRSISKQQPYPPRNPSAINWHSDASSISPNGALNDISQVRLAKNLSCPGMQDNIVGIIIRKVPSQHIELVKSICFDSGAMTNFQLQPQIQSIIVHFNSPLEARRCMSIIQNQINVRVDLINEDYMHCMTGAN